jgi:hypothetical protein
MYHTKLVRHDFDQIYVPVSRQANKGSGWITVDHSCTQCRFVPNKFNRQVAQSLV